MSDDPAAPRRWTMFPAKVVGPRTLQRVKVICTIDGLFVYGRDTGERIVRTLLAIDPYTAIRSGGGTWTLTDVNGDEWTVSVDRSAGCMCGDPLKRMSDTPAKYLNVEPEQVRIERRLDAAPAGV